METISIWCAACGMRKDNSAHRATHLDTMDAALNHVHVCDCGCKYWEGGRCVDCGEQANV